MEIQEIKRQLGILEVLHHYGLAPDKNNRLRCPFHDDKTPSMQVYPRTDSFCCFSTSCKAGTGDTIQFIQLMENCTKHEALTKATSMVSGGSTPSLSTPGNKPDATTGMETTAVLTKFFSYYKTGLPRSKKAVAYLQSRSLDYKTTEAAFNSGGLHVESKYHHLVESMVKTGLLKPLPTKGYGVWAKDSIVFPLKNADNKIVSLYGRSTTDNADSRHFYLQNRSGLYPCYPALTTKRLILTESVIDAASLLQQEDIKSSYAVLALYGTNGLTDEHQKALIELPQLEEIILMLDGDEAGKAAARRHYATLRNLLPETRISNAALPDGEDVNSVLCAHDDAAVLLDTIEDRQDFSFSSEKDNPGTVATPALQSSGRLNAQNHELLTYDNGELYFEVLGGIRVTGLDRMKVTLKIMHKQKPSLPLRDSLDLYNRSQTEHLVQAIGDHFDTNTKRTATTVSELTGALEQHRLQRMEAMQPREKTKEELTAAQRQQAINELRKPNLLQRTAQLLQQCGIVGEESNSMVAYLVYTVRKQPMPLHVMFLGTSGSGKTYLQEKISELVPDEDKMEITQITENALYYFKQHELQNKLLLIEDLDGAAAVFYPLRELQTKRRISKTVTLKDSRGNLKTTTLTVEGPVCVSGCTTREKIYEDNANRCILLYTDTTREQDRRINEYQTLAAAGAVDRERERQYKDLFRNIQRILRPVTVVNPYARLIQLPEQVFKPRRTMTLLLGFIEAVTFYHQYQRETGKDATGNPCIETTVEDIEAAFALLKGVLFSKSDELTKAARGFLEQLKALGVQGFTAKEIRGRLRLNPSNLKRYVIELERFGYLKGKGNRYRNYEYTIVDMDEYETLKSSIDAHLQDILATIRNSVGSQVVQ